jgi:hypothetical protein
LQFGLVAGDQGLVEDAQMRIVTHRPPRRACRARDADSGCRPD